MDASFLKTSGKTQSSKFHSREPETLLLELHDFLSANIPLDIFDLTLHDTNGTVRFVAFVKKGNALLTGDFLLRVSEQEMREVPIPLREDIQVFGNSLQVPFFQKVVERLHVPFFQELNISDSFPQPFSAMAIFSRFGSNFACITPIAAGENRYNSSHVDFVKSHYEQISWCAGYILSRLEVSSLQARLSKQHRVEEIVGSESGLKKTMDLVRKVAPLNSPVLITGETGAGKEVIANAIHLSSKRVNGPMVSVNCGAMPETLLDSELFGHEKGAFTGASIKRRGYFEQANGGTIFLDEIGELPLSAQVRLLRLLQNMEFYRVGGSQQIKADVRVIAATNRNLDAAIQNGLFRNDLWFRISVFPINVPPLRERAQDIPELAEHFARRKTREMSLPWRPVFADGAMAQLHAYHWPGNVRELQNVIERALVIFAGSPMSFPNLEIGEGQVDVASPLSMRTVMTGHIIKCLKLAKGRVEGRGGAAELLDMHPSTLRAKMRKLEIRVDGF